MSSTKKVIVTHAVEHTEDNQFELPHMNQDERVESTMQELTEVITKAIKSTQEIHAIVETRLQAI